MWGYPFCFRLMTKTLASKNEKNWYTKFKTSPYRRRSRLETSSRRLYLVCCASVLSPHSSLGPSEASHFKWLKLYRLSACPHVHDSGTILPLYILTFSDLEMSWLVHTVLLILQNAQAVSLLMSASTDGTLRLVLYSRVAARRGAPGRNYRQFLQNFMYGIFPFFFFSSWFFSIAYQLLNTGDQGDEMKNNVSISESV